MSDSGEQMLSRALDYARLGIRVLPVQGIREDGTCTCGRKNCHSPGKHPRTRNGLNDATTDEKQIRKWKWSRSNIGGVGIEHVCLDVDPRDGGDHSLADLEQEHGKVPRGAEVKTGRYGRKRGRHRWLSTNGRTVTSSSPLPGIQIKCTNGLAILPPSRHVSGVTYEWVSKPKFDPAPDWLLDLAANGTGERRVSDWKPSGQKPSGEVLGLLEEGDWPMGEQRMYACRVIRALLDWGSLSHEEIVSQVFDALERSDQDPANPWRREDLEKLVADLASSAPPAKQASDPEAASGRTGSPEDVLAGSRVDLVALIRDGIPEREYVPGCDPWLLVGKRYLIPAPAGTGKSLLGLVVAVTVVEAGGSVAILDLENGPEEYARRLNDVLQASDPDGRLAKACTGRLRYYAWPALSMKWHADEWGAAHEGVDLVIIDSSRLVLSAAGLDEDKSGDYAEFVNALLIPLAKAQTSTLTLDNTGHTEKNRARGSSAKSDLNEVVYVAKVSSGAEFDRDQAGELRLERARTRFAGVPHELRVPLGGGQYGPVSVVDQEAEKERRQEARAEETRHAVMIAVQKNPGISKSDLRRAVKGDSQEVWKAIGSLEKKGRIRIEEGPRGAKRHYPVPKKGRRAKR
jgi:hypothetical protein